MKKRVYNNAWGIQKQCSTSSEDSISDSPLDIYEKFVFSGIAGGSGGGRGSGTEGGRGGVGNAIRNGAGIFILFIKCNTYKICVNSAQKTHLWIQLDCILLND